MSTFTKTWIDGFSIGRLASLNNHCNDNPHMKVFCSFKESALKMLPEVGQKEVAAGVSPDECKWPKRKGSIAYFITKNDILFGKFPNLEVLVTRERNLNFEKDIGPLYNSKDDCREFMSANGVS